MVKIYLFAFVPSSGTLSQEKSKIYLFHLNFMVFASSIYFVCLGFNLYLGLVVEWVFLGVGEVGELRL
jgi:hypothetical protein